MKIAILAPIAWRTPPRKYGPWEQVASTLTEGLVEKGIDVTLFATGDSVTKAVLRYSVLSGYAENASLDPKVEECLHISKVMESASEFDLIHNHFDFLPLTYSALINTPMVTTIHGFSSPKITAVYKKYNRTNHYVSISDADRSPALDYIATVYNGIDTGQFTYSAQPDGYLLFFGRIHPDKGAHHAINIAKKAGKKLVIAGLIQDERYYRAEVLPHIDGHDISYAGNVDPHGRDRLLSNALALLHPIEFDEPFGLSVAESMLCGTPVIAFNRGAMPELIADRETGFLVKNVEEATKAVTLIPEISRKHCRETAMSRFSKEQMVDGYLRVYQQILSG